MATNDTVLSKAQVIKIELATEAFAEAVGDNAKTKQFGQRLRDYTIAHPTWNMKESIDFIYDRVMTTPVRDPETQIDLRVGMHTELNNRVDAAFSSDPRLKAAIAADAAVSRARSQKIEDIVRSDPYITQQMAILAVDEITTSGNNDGKEAKALAHAVNTMVHTNAAASLIAAFEHGKDAWTTEGRNAARYQEAKEGIIKDLGINRDNITAQQKADITTIADAAVPLAREAIKRNADAEKSGNSR